MGFNAAFRAAHCFCRFRRIQSIPVTQQKGFALTCRQILQRLFYFRDDLVLFQGFFRHQGYALIVVVLERVQRIEFLFLAFSGECGKQREPVASDLLAPAVIAYGILQDAVEQQGQFFRWLVAIFLCQLDHRILHDIEGCMAVLHRKHRVFVCATLNSAKKIVQFGLGCQFSLLRSGKF